MGAGVAERAAPPGQRGDRGILLALVVTMLVNQTGVVIISPLVVDIGRAFGVSVAAAAQLRTLSALVSAVVAPVIGVLSERTGRRPFLLAGLGVIAVGALLSALAPAFAWLLLAQAVGGLGVAALLSMGYAAVGDYFEPRRRAWAMGVVNVGQPLAWVTGLPLIGILADTLGWRWSFVGVPLLFSLIGVTFTLRLPRVTAAPAGERAAAGSAFGRVFADRSAASWIGAELAAYTGWAGTLTFLGAFYITQFHLSTAIASPLLALTALGFAVGSVVAHRLARARRQQVVILGSALVSAALLAFGLGHPRALPLTVTVLVCFGISQGVRGATSSSLGLQQAPQVRGTVMALRASVVQLGYVFGGLVGGLLVTHGGYGLMGLACAALIAGGGALTLLLVDEHREREVRLRSEPGEGSRDS